MGLKKEGLSPTGNVQKRKMMITQFIYICRGTLFSDKFIYIYIYIYIYISNYIVKSNTAGSYSLKKKTAQ